eukprot:TRINITY_DN41370_c0_g1_i1.p1 TRINITY_DN41370_c0_g1~~TRINITY_DN41370_c0_g1_i1.p1  ORF type:complete len:324 (+),score=43.21 TRINITY_DN41370_c0_g1_i1:79-972(+)
MVGSAMTFGNADWTTPHGGPPFHGWKRGFGFGKAAGPGQYYREPSIPSKLRHSPKADRHLASNCFWRTKSELGPAPGFGIGPRPEYAKSKGSVSPDNYGDVGLVLKCTRRNATRAGITVKPLFPSPEQKYRERGRAEAGPGPAKYDTSYKPGQSSWAYGARNSSWSMQPRPLAGMDLVLSMRQPGPGEYEARIPPGKNSPIQHGTLYNIGLKGRINYNDNAGNCSPGPARYLVKGELDQYTLGTQIQNTKVPKSYSEGTLVNTSGRSTTFDSFECYDSDGVAEEPPSPIAPTLLPEQ